MGRRSDIDWERVERLYVAGQLTIREIAEECKIGASSVVLKAKKFGWQRNLADAIKERTKAKIAQIDVQELIEQSAQESAQQSAQTVQKAIEEAANVQAGVVIRHRKSIKQDFEQAQSLQSAIESKIADLDAMEVGDIVRLTQAYKALVDAKSKLIEKERQAFGIEDGAEEKAEEGPTEIHVNLVGANG